MISGIVVSLQVMTMTEKTKLADVIIKRYFRLMLPLLPVGLLVYVMLKFGCFSHLDVAVYTQSPWAASMYNNPISLRDTLKSIFVNIWFYGDSTLSTAFWMLSKLFYGTFLSSVLSVISWKYTRNTWLIYLVLALFLFNRSDLAFAFVLGTLLASVFSKEGQIKPNVFGGAALVIGLFLGGYPSGVSPTNVYEILNGATAWDWHAIGAFLTLLGIWNCKGIRSFLSLKVWHWLGRISYSIYLLHIPLLFSVTTSIFLLVKDSMRYSFAVFVSLLISVFVLVGAAWAYNRVVERSCVSLQKKIVGFFEESQKV